MRPTDLPAQRNLLQKELTWNMSRTCTGTAQLLRTWLVHSKGKTYDPATGKTHNHRFRSDRFASLETNVGILKHPSLDVYFVLRSLVAADMLQTARLQPIQSSARAMPLNLYGHQGTSCRSNWSSVRAAVPAGSSDSWSCQRQRGECLSRISFRLRLPTLTNDSDS